MKNNFFAFEKKLGFGFFRLPMQDGKVDYDECKKMVDTFMSAGFKYFDVAKPYMGEQSEKYFKKCVAERYPRDKFIIANKLSHEYFAFGQDIYKVFENQLKDCGVDYFDIYLMHCQMRTNYYDYKNRKAYEIAKELKQAGKIKYIGFSFHDSADFLETILLENPEIDVVQLQINYYDYDDNVVQSKLCLEVCEKYKKPVIVMEPVKAGTLVNVPEEADRLLRSLKPEGSNASFAIRFAAGCPGVCMVLSGMSNISQMEDNISYMREFEPLDEKAISVLKRVRSFISSKDHIQCTNCCYCVKGCPQNIKIPNILSLVNSKRDFMYNLQFDQYYWNVYVNENGKASDCIGCGKCERVCPQHLSIRNHMNVAKKIFEIQDAYFDNILEQVNEYKKINNEFIIYGNGMFGQKAIKYFRKNIPDINIINVAITDKINDYQEIDGIEVVSINTLTDKKNTATVLIMSIKIAFVNQMRETLSRLGFNKVLDFFN